MKVYADSSFLVSLIREDGNSPAAARWATQMSEPLPFTPLHRLEVLNGFRLAVRRGELDSVNAKMAIARLERDLDDDIFVHQPIPWTDALRRAEALSAAYTEELGCRSLDILHVAAALETGAKIFLSFDTAQRKLAKASGLQVKP